MTSPALWFSLWLLPGLLAGPVSTLTHEQQLALLSRANTAFEQALSSENSQQIQGAYRQAINAYEQLIAAGVQNAKLYYNLGNAYFHIHDLGRAIVQYRRGLRLEPGNARLQANLHYAQSQRLDQIDPKSDQLALWTQLLFWRHDLSLHTQVLLAVLSFLLIWACACLRLFLAHPGLKWLLISAVLVWTLLTGSALSVHAQHATTRHGVIVAQEAPLRKGNGESYALQLPHPLHPGTEFVVVEEHGAWLNIQLDNGANGWLRHEQAVLW